MMANQNGVDTTQVTVDRVSNNGNPIAQEQVDGRVIQIPAGAVGETYEVRLIDQGGYFEAELVNRIEEAHPRTPSISSGEFVDVSKGRQKNSHEFGINNSPAGGRLRGIPDSERENNQQK